jgi:hypothetical protein
VEISWCRTEHCAAFGIVRISHGAVEGCSIRIAQSATSARPPRAKFHISDNLRNLRSATYLVVAVWLADRSLSELLGRWSSQRFLAERIMTIVTHFRAQVVKFIFGGRNSGQRRNEEATLLLYDAINANGSQPPDSKILICGLGIMDHNIFRNGQDAPLPVKFDPVGGIGREFDFAGFCPKSSHHTSNRTALLKLCNQ